MADEPLDVEAIKSRLIRAGYQHPGPEPSRTTREVSRQMQEARADLRDHIIDDVWALLDEVESMRRGRM